MVFRSTRQLCPARDSNSHFTVFKAVSSAVGIAGRSNGGSRTLTEQVLKLLPLPIGLQCHVSLGNYDIPASGLKIRRSSSELEARELSL